MAKLRELDRLLLSVLAVALMVIVIVAVRYISEFSLHVLSDQEKWGQFGDYFGGVLNPIFSFFALVAILYTLRTQVENNEEGERRHEEQLREQRLFQLVGLMNENALSTKVVMTAYVGSTPNEYSEGHQALHYALIRLRDALDRRVSVSAQIYETDMEIFVSGEEAFKSWKQQHWISVGLYLSSVFLVLEFVLKEKSSEEFKKFAMSMLRVQLTESERLLLWYVSMFKVDCVTYLAALQQAGFIDDHDASLDDRIMPWREKLVACSRQWSQSEIKKRSST